VAGTSAANVINVNAHELIRADAAAVASEEAVATAVITSGEFFIGVDSDKHVNRWALEGDEADAAIDAMSAQGPTDGT